jgi:hypothetical protein
MNWEQLVAHLRKRCPIRKRLVVCLKPLRDELDGITHLSGNERTITIIVNSKKPWATQVDSLVHEWGHALWMDDMDWHDDRWGKLHSRAYRALKEFVDESC